MSAVGKAVGKATDFLVGGKKSTIQGNNFGNMSDEEKARLDDVESEINKMFGEQGTFKNVDQQQASDIQNLFATNLKQFLTNGGQQTPEQLQQASDFVDKTFTNPTQNVVNQNVADYQSQAQAKAAALGRDPNADIATQQAIAGEGLRQNIGLQSERGSRIQQASNDIFNRGLSSLNTGMQGSGFLNGLTQQAFQNQLGLLNARTGLADFYQKNRSLATINTPQTSSGLFTNLNSIVGAGSNLVSSVKNFGGGMGGGGGGGSNGPSGEYLSSIGGIGGK